MKKSAAFRRTNCRRCVQYLAGFTWRSLLRKDRHREAPRRQCGHWRYIIMPLRATLTAALLVPLVVGQYFADLNGTAANCNETNYCANEHDPYWTLSNPLGDARQTPSPTNGPRAVSGPDWTHHSARFHLGDTINCRSLKATWPLSAGHSIIAVSLTRLSAQLSAIETN